MKLLLGHFMKTVTTAGTAEQITTANKRVPSLVFQAEVNNTGQVYVGNSTVSATDMGAELDSGDVYEFNATKYGDALAVWDISDFWIDVSVSTDGVHVSFAERDDDE